MSFVQREPPILAQLCTLLIDDQYGELASRVFSILARQGRQTLAGLVRCSYLSGREIKHGLVVLIQQHLLFHSSLDPRVTYYEVDWQSAYALVRYGKIIKMVSDRFGQKAGNIVSNLINLGHTSVDDLREAFFPTRASDTDADSDSDDGLPKGINGGTTKTNEEGVNGIVNTLPLASKHDETRANGVGKGKADIRSHDVPSELLENGTSIYSLKNGIKQSSGQGDTDKNLTNGISNKTKLNGVANGEKANSAGASGANAEYMEHGEEPGNRNISTVQEFYDILVRLTTAGWIIEADSVQYLSPGDLRGLCNQQALDELFPDSNPSGPKAKARLEAKTLELMREYRDESTKAPSISRKRGAPEPDAGRHNKRIKLNGNSHEAVTTTDPDLTPSPFDKDINIRLNLAKVGVAMRNERLVCLVEQRLGPTTAHIYQTMLCSLEPHYARCFEEWPNENEEEDSEDTSEMRSKPMHSGKQPKPEQLITARDIAKLLDPDVDLLDGLDPHEAVAIPRQTSSQCHPEDHIIKPPINPFELRPDERVNAVDRHMQMLSRDKFPFVTWYSRQGVSEWHVEYDKIAKGLVQLEIENTIKARRGQLGVKLVRALQMKGRLDERQVCDIMMMSGAEIRQISNDLTTQGFVQTQEIPKVDRREAKLSIHLIWYDKQRTREKLLHDTYKGMVRTMQRIAFEKSKVADVLRKAERTDVVGKEEKFLNKYELAALRKWQEVEQKLLLQLFREDDLVATLRDYTGPIVSV